MRAVRAELIEEQPLLLVVGEALYRRARRARDAATPMAAPMSASTARPSTSTAAPPDAAHDWPRSMCCGKSSCYFCPQCCRALPPEDGSVKVPRVSLPLRVAVILHEERRKSTGLHAQVLAPEHVVVHDVKRGQSFPPFDPATTVVAFPSADSQPWSELPDLDGIEQLVVLCCPWQMHHKLIELPQLLGVRRVRIANVPETSDFWRVPLHDAGHLSTIEALARLLDEYSLAAAGTAAATGGAAAATGGTAAASADELAPRSPLLYLFDLIRAKIVRAGGEAGSCLPWESTARAKRRRELEQPDRVKVRSVGRLRGYYAYEGEVASSDGADGKAQGPRDFHGGRGLIRAEADGPEALKPQG